MLDLQRCRGLLGPVSHDLRDDQIEVLRGQLYTLAGAMISVQADQGQGGAKSLTEDERAELDERAAILEFDANLPRSLAERLAVYSYGRHRPQ